MMTKLKRYFLRCCHYIIEGQPIVQMRPNIITISQSELLTGRIALITGGTSGIGLAIAEAFLRAGAGVIITSRSIERAQQTAAKLNNNFPNAFVLGVDMDNADVSSLKKKINGIIDVMGGFKINILVNNAGIDGGWWGEFDDTTFSNVLNTNLTGTYFLSMIISSYMIENKIQGNILNICSSSSIRPADSAYAISKWGLRGFTLGLARNLTKKKYYS